MLLAIAMCGVYFAVRLMSGGKGDCVVIAATATQYAVANACVELLSAKSVRKKLASKAGNAMHDGPKGKRSAKDEIIRIWASGKYTSRALCAEQECAALGMSFDTARKALRNTPDPA